MLKRFFNRIMNNKEENTMKQGTVKFFNEARGFGFIKVNDSDEEVFVHTTNLLDNIREDDHVEFEVEEGEKGPSAVRVRLI